NRKRLTIRLRSILQNADRDCFPELDGGVAVAAPVDAIQNAVTEGDDMRELVQFAVDCELSRIAARVGEERKPVAARHHRIGDHEVTVEEEFQAGDASARDG